MIHIYIAALLLLLGFSGCGSEKRVISVAAKSYPAWYTNPPRSNDRELYALGEGKNKQEAIANGLSEMISTLSVSISSEFYAKRVVKEGQINSSNAEYTSEVQSRVKEIRISNYKVLNAESLGFKKYAVLVSSNKKKLFESMKQEIEQEFTIIKESEKSTLLANALKQLKFYKKAKESLSTLPNRLLVMRSLESSFSGEEYLALMQDIEAKYTKIAATITFWVTSDRGVETIREPIAKALSAKRFKLSQNSSKSHFTTLIKTDIEQASSYGFTLARATLFITTKDAKGVVIGSNSIPLIGQSTQGYAVAKQNLVSKLSSLIEKEGIAKVLGLDI